MKYALDEQAQSDFNKQRWRESIGRILSFVLPHRRDLLSLQEVKDLLRPRSETYLGMRTVPLSAIVGSEGRYRDFDRRFLPRYEYLRGRWMRVDMAHLTDVILPPIKLYQIGGMYFVRDGNHRVSVAKAKGVQEIDAEVVGLNSEVHLHPGMDRKSILDAIIRWEQGRFCRRTGYDKLWPADELLFTATGRYDEIFQHILVHKYYINQTFPEEIPFRKAMVSWHDNVFRPTVRVILEGRMLRRFPERTPADLYAWIVQHWDALKQKYGQDYSIEDATRDYAHTYGKGLLVRILDGIYEFYLTVIKRDRV